jgi:hypothetical protein
MASTKLNIAIASLIAETQLSTVDKLFGFLGEKVELDDDMKGYFDEFRGTFKVGKKGGGVRMEAAPKAKRAPSAYNLYIRDKMAEFKAAGHTGNLMKMAIEAWNADKSV